MNFSGSDIAAIVVVMVSILGPIVTGARKGMNEGVMRDTPVTVPAGK